MLVRAPFLLLVLFLGACSISGLLPDWNSTDVAGPEPAYRFVIANGLSAIVGDPAKAGMLEISGSRRVDSLKGASWVICLKIQNFPLLPHYYAIFMQRERIVDSRLSVLVDQCELQTYSPFDWVPDANAPPVR
jgi:hypothetical protein